MHSRFLKIIFFAAFIFTTHIFSLTAQEEQAPGRENPSLMQMAWKYYEEKDFTLALEYINKCIEIFDARAKEQQRLLSGAIPLEQINLYWALNDVASAKFLRAKVYLETGRADDAKAGFEDVAKNYRYAMAYDLRGWYWDIARTAQNKLDAINGTGIDCGDCSSGYLASKSWEMFNNKNYELAVKYSEKCIDMYKPYAVGQQASLKRLPNAKDAPRFWALNDVGVSYYLAGRSYLKLGENEKAREYFEFVTEKLSYAQSWDNKGWFWQVAEAAKKELK